jgi:hypothetical protein
MVVLWRRGWLEVGMTQRRAPSRRQTPVWKTAAGISAIATLIVAVTGFLALFYNSGSPEQVAQDSKSQSEGLSTPEREGSSEATPRSTPAPRAGDGSIGGLIVRLENGSGIDGLGSRYVENLKPVLAGYDVSYQTAFVPLVTDTELRLPSAYAQDPIVARIRQVVDVSDKYVTVDESLSDKIVVVLGFHNAPPAGGDDEEECSVPEGVVGLPLDEALDRLGRAQLVPIREPVYDGSGTGRVLEVDPAEGWYLDCGSDITVRYSASEPSAATPSATPGNE